MSGIWRRPSRAGELALVSVADVPYGGAMSIPVAIADLVAATSDYDWAYLLTVSDDERPHVVAARPAWNAETLVMDVGRRTAANAAARTSISLCYPPVAAGGYSLIVDGEASVDGSTVTFAPSGAVLHRPAAPDAPESVTGCVNDCAPVGAPASR